MSLAYCCPFQEVKIEEELWLLLKAGRFEQKIAKLVEIISNYYYNSILGGKDSTHIIKKVAGECYKIRLSQAYRLAFKITEENGKSFLWLSKILTHSQGNQLHKQGYQFLEGELLNYAPLREVLESDSFLDITPHHESFAFSTINRVWSPEEEKRLLRNVNCDLRRALNKAQETFLNEEGPILLKGAAGSGKTTVALYRLIKSSAKKKLYVTLTKSLKYFAQECFKNLTDELDVEIPEFLTIEELCLKLINSGNGFKPGKKMSFELFKELSFVKEAFQKTGIDSYILWEEIRAIVKQSSTKITRNNYPSFQQNKKVIETVLSIYNEYAQYLSINQMWDDVDLAKAALQGVTSSCLQEYEEVIVDEVQDLTTTQIRLLCYITQTPFGVFMTGDESQSIHGSKFDWLNIKSIIDQAFCQKGYGEKAKMRYLAENYRSPEPIFNLSRNILQWRRELFHIPLDKQAGYCHKKGGFPITIIPPDYFKNISLSILPHTTMVIVPSEQVKGEAIKKFGIASVLTVYEAKGLENKEVILYGFFEDSYIKRAFNTLINFIGLSPKSQNFITLLNILNVAITRTENKLYVVSHPDNIYSIPVFKNFDFAHSQGGELLKFLTSQDNNRDGYFNWAKKLELSGALLQAEANYKQAARLGHKLGKAFAAKCRGLIEKQRHNYSEALQCFYEAFESNDESILREIYECEGILQLFNQNFSLGVENLIAAKMSVAEIIQKILASNNPDKYNFCLSVILKQDTSLLDYFLANPTNVKNLTLTKKQVLKINPDEKIASIYIQGKTIYLKKEVKAKTQLLQFIHGQFINYVERYRGILSQIQGIDTGEAYVSDKNGRIYKRQYINFVKKVETKLSTFSPEFEMLVAQFNEMISARELRDETWQQVQENLKNIYGDLSEIMVNMCYNKYSKKFVVFLHEKHLGDHPDLEEVLKPVIDKLSSDLLVSLAK